MSRLSRGPQRDATLSLSPITSPSLTATTFEKPGRLATVAADTLQQIVSARKIILGSAAPPPEATDAGALPRSRVESAPMARTQRRTRAHRGTTTGKYMSAEQTGS